MSAYTLVDLDLNPVEATELGQAIIEETFKISDTDMSNLYDINTGIQYDEQIPFIDQIGHVGQVSADCTPPPVTGVDITQKLWTPKMIEGRLEHCQKDVSMLFKLAQQLSRVNPDFYDRIGNPLFQLVGARLMDAMQRAIFRLIWLGDTAAQTISNGGVFNDAVDIGFYTPFDGFWKQIVAAVGGSKIDIPQNQEATFADQLNLDADSAQNIFQAMYNAADPRLRTDPEARFYVTDTLFLNYKNYLANTPATAGGLTQALIDGVPTVAFQGIPVEPLYELDRLIQSDQAGPAAYNLPHRAVLSVRRNLAVGTVSTTDFENLEIWYDRTDKKNYMDFAFKLDSKMLEDFFTVVAY